MASSPIVGKCHQNVKHYSKMRNSWLTISNSNSFRHLENRFSLLVENELVVMVLIPSSRQRCLFGSVAIMKSFKRPKAPVLTD